MPIDKVAPNYLKDGNFLFLGTLLLALAIEESQLHTRLAIGILSRVGDTDAG